jgi:hypothetical protein
MSKSARETDTRVRECASRCASACARSVEGTMRQYFPVSRLCTVAGSGQFGSGRVGSGKLLLVLATLIRRLGKLLLVLASTVILGSGFSGTHDHESARSAAELRVNKP